VSANATEVPTETPKNVSEPKKRNRIDFNTLNCTLVLAEDSNLSGQNETTEVKLTAKALLA
jgi:hypothetical protein